MLRFVSSLICATAFLAMADVALAGGGDLNANARGMGYTATDAPLGPQSELRIDLRGQVPVRCELLSPPDLPSNLILTRAGETQATFTIDCNAPFRLRVHSESGGFASTSRSTSIAALAPYEVSVSLDTETGRQTLDWCTSESLTDTPTGSCEYAPSTGRQGWSSGEATAIDKDGVVRLRWNAPTAAGPPMLGAYRDVITIQVEAGS